MEKHQVIKEVIAYLQAEKSRLEQDFSNKEKQYSQVVVSFSELSFTPFWRQPLKPLLKKFLARRAEKLRREILNLRLRIQEFTQAIVDLKKGIYFTAIPLMNQLSDRHFFYPLLSPVISIAPAYQASRPNLTFYYILDLTKRLITLQKERE